MPTWLHNRLRDRLKEQRVPYYQLRDGPERMTNLPGAESHIVLQRDDESGDVFIRPIGTSPVNPSVFRTQQIGMEALIFARAAKSGASAMDHEDEGDALVCQVTRALYHIFTDRRWEVRRAGYLSKARVEELAFGDWPGRIYQLLFTFNATLADRDYLGNALEEFEMGPGGVPFETELEIDGGQGGRELPRATTEV